MVAVTSTMQDLGSPAIHFSLTDVRNNAQIELTHGVGKPVLLMFICNHCPYVIHLIDELAKMANSAQQQGYFVAAISANDAVAYPQDGPEAMRDFAQHYGFEFPYLYDETQEIAKQYGAACTPDFFVYDTHHALQYRGQMDASRPSNNEPVTGDDLQAALQAVLNNQAAPARQVASIGCNIKWKQGNEPDYF